MKAEPTPWSASEERELRRWAVEQAVKWPQVLISSAGSGSGAVWTSGPGTSYVDADVIGRAEKLVTYVLDKKSK